MLEKIYLHSNHSSKQHDLQNLCERIKASGIEAALLPKETMESIKTKNVLMVTDSSNLCKSLSKKDFCVVAYLHEENQGEDFCIAPYAIEKIEEVPPSYFEFVYKRYVGLPLTILETKRCVLREITVEDVDALYEIYQGPGITDYMEDLFKDRAKEKEYTRDYIANIYGFYGYGMWVVVQKETGKIIGRAGIEQREEIPGHELGFVIAQPFQRKGYAFEICKAIIEYAKEVLAITKLHCFVKKENKPSLALCRKLGFSYVKSREIRGEVFEEYRKAAV